MELLSNSQNSYLLLFYIVLKSLAFRQPSIYLSVYIQLIKKFKINKFLLANHNNTTFSKFIMLFSLFEGSRSTKTSHFVAT
jgi:hypothetical protein